eukprot:644605-Pelagomonas_calceolata.AAC.4
MLQRYQSLSAWNYDDADDNCDDISDVSLDSIVGKLRNRPMSDRTYAQHGHVSPLKLQTYKDSKANKAMT